MERRNRPNVVTTTLNKDKSTKNPTKLGSTSPTKLSSLSPTRKNTISPTKLSTRSPTMKIEVQSEEKTSEETDHAMETIQ